MATKILMIHGRGQATNDPDVRNNPTRLAEYVNSRKRDFLAGLAKGLVLADRPPVRAEDTVFPFYGNDFQDTIDAFEKTGGTPPVLEAAIAGAAVESSGGGGSDEIRELADLQATMLEDLAARLDYRAERELEYAGESGQELALSDFLNVPVITGALQFLSRKTGVPAVIIRRHLADVAYYLGRTDMRDTVLNIVRRAIDDNTDPHDELIVIAHSLGSVVGYDLLNDPRHSVGRRVKLFVTAGSPLGLKVVRAKLLGKTAGKPAGVPSALPRSAKAWINAYDVTDIVALIHPLAPEFRADPQGQLVDERTHNPTGPHAIIDYLADPDIAAPISRAMS